MSYWAERRMPTLPETTLRRVPDDIARWKVAYWQFQHALTNEHIIPFLAAHAALPRASRILEVGAGEGGCLAALTAHTGLPGDGLELSPPRAELGARLNAALGYVNVSLHAGNIARMEELGDLTPPYALVLLRDVIEHVEERDPGMQNLFALTAPGGHALFTFPPYYSAYGGHQQIATRRLLKAPWIQNLPFFPSLLRACEPNAGTVDELMSIRRCRLTITAFERSARAAGFCIVSRKLYLSRPAFRYRYATPIVAAGLLGRIRGVRELLTTGAWYLLRRPPAPSSVNRESR